ncbi:MAG: DEAD/DEAH box helicase family protein [Gemmataceae bacterium]|nr:DEAD/DEAH box helicase family protein [Gemmata sp.]MDW8198011.1 DEAD/DEAH box helicase family protein [Gemmataceae bacterium]
MSETPIVLRYDRGTVVVSGGPRGFALETLPGVLFDPRTSHYRAPGRYYRAIVEYLLHHKIPYEDTARGWANEPVGWKLVTERTPRDYQRAAVNAWMKSGCRGLIVMPTGTGKTFTAFLCIEKVSRPTLVVTPKIDLMVQWHTEMEKSFGVEVGMVGGNEHNWQPLTAITYDSAYIHLEKWANRYGLIIFDECHHLPGPAFSVIANASLAPFRMGLTATPERADGGDMLFPELVGPIAYRLDITDVAGEHLAPYQTHRLYVDLTPQEEETYRRCRDEYRQFVAERGINMNGPEGFRRFLFEASRTPEGWKALRAYREQKRIVQAAQGKMELLEKLLLRHAHDRVLIFTADNATVYAIARRFLIPAMTNQTKPKERKSILAKFHAGYYTALVTCQVLNEGVDVPAAGVGIIMGGTGSATENVQRLGRILRKYGDKQAVLYEVIAKNTAEEFVSDRRRQHRAFQ